MDVAALYHHLEVGAKIHCLFLIIFSIRVAYSIKITGKIIIDEGILTEL